MLVALVRLDLRIPGCGSLKEKRHVVKTLVAAVRTKFNVSVAEAGYQDLWQRAELAVAIASSDGYQARKVAHQVSKFVDAFPAVETIDSELTLHYPDD
jgi:hypothetical protein